MALRILFVNQAAQFQGGIESNIYATAQGFAERGHELHLAVWTQPEDPEFALPFASTECLPLPLGPALAAYVKRLRPDLVYVHKIDHTRMLNAPALATPVVRMIHDHDLVCVRRHRYLPGSLKACDRRAGLLNCAGCGLAFERSRGGKLPVRWRPVWDRLSDVRECSRLARTLVASHYMADQLALHGVPRDRLAVVPLGIPDLPAEGAAGPQHVIYVGQIVRTKGLDVLLRALVRLPHLTLNVIGDGPQREEFAALAAKLGLTHRVKWLGRQPATAIHRALGEALAAVMPGRWPEPFGLVGVEAMRAARPVVASDVGGVREWLVPNLTGILVAAGQPGALAEALQALHADQSRANAMGAAARARFEEKFMLAQYLDRLETTLMEAARRPR